MMADGTVAAILSLLHWLVFAEAGDDKWIMVDKASGWTDVLHYRGQFYAVDNFGSVFVCELKPLVKVARIASSPVETKAYRWYLVESLGELLLVARYMTDKPQPFPHAYETKKFEVFRIDQKKEIKLVKVESLGDPARSSIFLTLWPLPETALDLRETASILLLVALKPSLMVIMGAMILVCSTLRMAVYNHFHALTVVLCSSGHQQSGSHLVYLNISSSLDF